MHQITTQQWNELNDDLKTKFQEAINIYYGEDEYPEYSHLLTYLNKFDDFYTLEQVEDGAEYNSDKTDINSRWQEVVKRLKNE